MRPAWKQAFTEKRGYDGYRRELGEAMFNGRINSMEKIETGLKKAAADNSPFMPSVGQFVAWCQPSLDDMGIPNPEAAYLDAAHKRWGAHPIVYLAAVEVGVFEVATKSERMMKDKYIKSYSRFADRVLAGEVFEKHKFQQIENQQKKIEAKPVTKEESNTARLKALAIMGIKR